MITHALAPAVNKPLIKACKEQPFTIICDGGNDNFEKKYFGIMEDSGMISLEKLSQDCICHLAALCAAAALKKLPLSIDDLLIDIFYHFKHSSKRCVEFSMVLMILMDL